MNKLMTKVITVGLLDFIAIASVSKLLGASVITSLSIASVVVITVGYIVYTKLNRFEQDTESFENE